LPINIEQLDSSASEENITLLLGRAILLKIVETPEAKSLLENELVKKLISSENLSSEKTVNAISALVDAPPLSSLDWIVYGSTPASTSLSLSTRPITFQEYAKNMSQVISDFSFSTTTVRRGASALTRLKAKEKKNLELEQMIKDSTGLDLLEPSVALICPSCKNVLQIGEFKGQLKCRACEKEVNRASAKRLPVHQVPEPIAKVWRSGLWFEAYFAKFLRKLDWKTWVKVYIMGSSGVPHEIDILGIKGGNIIVVECKTGKVSRQDVFNFLTKTQDLKVHMGFLALLENMPEPETKDFVKKNRLLHLLEGIKSRKEEDILSDLRAVLPA